MKEAMFWQSLDGKVQCTLCQRRCVIEEGKRGICRVRENRGGKLYTLSYGRIVSYGVDPIEKKPLFHFMPGSQSFSIATAGCNFKCLHCQNWEISQFAPDELPYTEMSPEKIVKLAKDLDCQSISYTYTEPTIFYEFAYDTGVLAKKEGLYNVFVTNGYATPEAIKKAKDFLHAANIDFKGGEKFYKDVCGGVLFDRYLASLKAWSKTKTHIELTYLLIPGYNDDEDTMHMIPQTIQEIFGKETPLHITRFYPAYKMMDVPPTALESLERAWQIAKEYLDYVYLGNILGSDKENTYCPNCGALLIKRFGFEILEYNLEKGRCPNCGKKIYGVFKD